jgi:hypothetical protein
MLCGCGQKKEESRDEKQPKKETKPRVAEPRPDENEPAEAEQPPRPTAPKLTWKTVVSKKHNVQFDLPDVLVQRGDEDAIMAWDEKKTFLFAGAQVKSVEEAEKEIAKLLERIKIQPVKYRKWTDVTHNGMKGKKAVGLFESTEGEKIHGLAMVLETGPDNNVGMLMLVRADKSAAYRPHVKRLMESIKKPQPAKEGDEKEKVQAGK